MTQNKPFVLGLTGPAGTGKSVVLTYLKERWKALVLECDAIARSMQMPAPAPQLALTAPQKAESSPMKYFTCTETRLESTVARMSSSSDFSSSRA